jgi:hypothetical protein
VGEEGITQAPSHLGNGGTRGVLPSVRYINGEEVINHATYNECHNVLPALPAPLSG